MPDGFIQRISLLDLLIKNTDRHLGNILIGQDAILIDNGSSCPHKHPDDPWSRRHLYNWTYLPGSDNVYDEEIMKKYMEQVDWLAMVRELDEEIFQKGDPAHRVGSLRVLLDQILIVQYHVETKKSPADAEN